MSSLQLGFVMHSFLATMLQCVAMRSSEVATKLFSNVSWLLNWLCVAVCCSVLQCVAVCCSVLMCVAVCCGSELHMIVGY